MLHDWKMNAYIVSVGNTEGKRQLGRHKYIFEDNTKMDTRGIK
jgi:hypothetical protein